MRIFKRYIELIKFKCDIIEKIKILYYITTFYILLLLKMNLDFFPDYIKPQIRLRTKSGREIKLAKMKSSGQVHAFIELFLDDEYELSTINYGNEKIVLIDFGANVGLFPSAVEYFGNKIESYFTVEPMKENLKILEEQVNYLFNKKNYKIFQGAVGKNNRVEEFIFDYGSSKSIINKNEKRKTEKVNVISFKEIMQTIESKCKKNDNVFFKIDIEGGEWEIIDELIAYLKNHKKIKAIFIELHTINNSKTYEMIANKIENCLDNFEFKRTEENPKNIVLLGKRKE